MAYRTSNVCVNVHTDNKTFNVYVKTFRDLSYYDEISISKFIYYRTLGGLSIEDLKSFKTLSFIFNEKTITLQYGDM